MSVQPAADAAPARWLLRRDVDWQCLVRCGPPGFEVYLRIRLSQVAIDEDPSGEAPILRQTLAILANHTTTPSSGYAAIWEGWTSNAKAPSAPRVPMPQRPMLLFTGQVEALRDAPALAWYGSAQGQYAEPHLVWPADQAWCLACDVDEEIEFTVGCSDDAAKTLIKSFPGAVRRVRYGETGPLFRDPA